MKKEGRKRDRMLVKLEREEAVAMAEELIAQVQPLRVAMAALVQQYGVSERVARTVVDEAHQQLKAVADVLKPELQQVMKRRFEALYRRAWSQGQLGVCVQVLMRISRMEGIEGPIEVHHTGPPTMGEEFADRTTEELDYYGEHGHWPGQPLPTAQGVPHRAAGNPMEKLH